MPSGIALPVDFHGPPGGAGQDLGSVTPAAAVSGQRAFLRGFFDRYL